MLFGKKKNKENPSTALLAARDGREISYIVERLGAADETVIGKKGVLNVVEGEFVISCENSVVFRAPITEIRAFELMNLSGINLVFGGRTYVAYYTKGIENK